VGDKAGVEEIGDTLRTGGESLSKYPKGGTHTECQTTKKPNKQNRKKQKNKKNNGRIEVREEGDRRQGTQ
jgi:hypothetical protein